MTIFLGSVEDTTNIIALLQRFNENELNQQFITVRLWNIEEEKTKKNNKTIQINRASPLCVYFNENVCRRGLL